MGKLTGMVDAGADLQMIFQESRNSALRYCCKVLGDSDGADQIASTAAEGLVLLVRSTWKPGLPVPMEMLEELGRRAELLEHVPEGARLDYDLFFKHLVRQLTWSAREQRKRDTRRFKCLSVQEEGIPSHAEEEREEKQQREKLLNITEEEFKKMTKPKRNLLSRCLDDSKAALAKEEGVSRATMSRRAKVAGDELKKRVVKRLKQGMTNN